MGYLKIFPIRIADMISYMHSIITTNPNESCLSSLGSISNNSQNHRNIYFVETFSCSRLHAKSKKSKFRIILKNTFIRIADPISYKNFKRFLSSVPQPESPFAKKIKQKRKSKKELIISNGFCQACLSQN